MLLCLFQLFQIYREAINGAFAFVSIIVWVGVIYTCEDLAHLCRFVCLRVFVCLCVYVCVQTERFERGRDGENEKASEIHSILFLGERQYM